MEWCVLDIRKAGVLKKETDLALLAFEQAKEEPSRRGQLVRAFQQRIDDIEEFRSQHDSDERSILFEKERLRLRKAVQDALKASSAATPVASAAAAALTGGGKMSGVVKHISFRKTPSKKKTAGDSAVDNLDASLSAGGGGNKTPAKIYDWEGQDEGKAGAPERGMISVDGSIFAPCREPGMYVAAKEELDPAAPEEYVDVQVVLSKHEVTLLASRMLKREDPQKSHFKSQMSSGSVHHAAPYVDQSKLLKDLYRPTHPEAWIAGDLRPNAKR